MNLNQWKYRTFRNDYLHLENWMKFTIELANYIKKVEQPIKLYISVPSNLIFSYFFVFGAINYDFNSPPKETLIEKYLSLKKGQRILYKTGEKWVAHSVIEVSKIPNADIKAIVVKDRLNSVNYIPETRWIDYVRIYDNEVTKVRNTRRVNNVGDITDDIKLKNIYPETKLNLLMMQNIPKTYLYTNKNEWLDNISIIQLKYANQHIQLEELLYGGTTTTFKNFSFIQQNHSSLLPPDSTVIFVGSSRTLRKMDEFKKQKCVFIIDQHDSNEKIEELQFKIEQEYIMGKGQSFNKEILRYMDNEQIQIPKGVEVFAWLS